MASVAQVSRVATQMVLVAQVSLAAPPVEETPQVAEEEKILAGQKASPVAAGEWTMPAEQPA